MAPQLLVLNFRKVLQAHWGSQREWAPSQICLLTEFVTAYYLPTCPSASPFPLHRECIRIHRIITLHTSAPQVLRLIYHLILAGLCY